MNDALQTYIGQRAQEFERIPPERRTRLSGLVDYMRKQREAAAPIQLVFICTHNSRRSHMAQAAALAAAEFYSLEQVSTFSGGTEATAFFQGAREAIEAAGFLVQSVSGGDDSNPHFEVGTGAGGALALFYSKKFSHADNPQENFAAVMVCSDADEACPLVPGATVRVSLPYSDPKQFDGTDQAATRYAERMADITREVLFAVSQV